MIASTSPAPHAVPDIEAMRRRARLALAEAGIDPRRGVAAVPGAEPGLQALLPAAVLDSDASPLPALLAPVLPEGGLMLVHGPRGVGRSHVLVGCAAALAAGDWFLGWRARRAADVLFLSGAASSAMLGARLEAALRAMRGSEAARARLRLLAPDQRADAMPALDAAQGQARLVPLLAAADVLVIDDAGPLVHGMNSNAARSQWQFGEFLRRLRHAGRTVLVGQASGAGLRSRADRGALACLEAQADVVIGLRRPAGYQARDGARFELHIERANHLPGSAREVREIRLAASADRQAMWRAARAADLARTRFHALLAEGMAAAEAGRELGLDRTTAWRWAKRFAAERVAANFPGPAAERGMAAVGAATSCGAPAQALDTAIGIAA